RLLAARRSAPKSLAGRWEFAGGKVEPDETPEQAVHRELWEELGIRVRLGAEIASTAATEPAASPTPWPILNNLTMRIWFARIAGGRAAALADHDELRRRPVPGLRSGAWLEPDLPSVDAIAARACSSS